MTIVIYHNPDCGTSRNVLGIIQAAGYAPTIIDYQTTGWTEAQLLGLFAAADLTPRTALRVSKTNAEALGLTDPATPDAMILAAMLMHPLLVNRPIVCSPRGVRLCRPSEAVLDLLDQMPPGPVYKEDGTPVIDAAGNRVG